MAEDDDQRALEDALGPPPRKPMSKREREEILGIDPETGVPEGWETRGSRLAQTDLSEFADVLSADQVPGGTGLGDGKDGGGDSDDAASD